MLRLNKLHIVNFRNIAHAELSFDTNFAAFCGKNGAGKTNSLDAIYYLCVGKSFFNGSDQFIINHNESFFNLTAVFDRNDKAHEVFCASVKGARKKIRVNDREYEKLSDHVGEFPLVMITPYDNMLISGGSEERRRFMDFLIAQLDRDYMEALMKYNKVLSQRNALLVQMNERHQRQNKLLEVYDEQLCSYAAVIYERRSSFLEPFKDVFQTFYNKISSGDEEVGISYQSQLNSSSMQELLSASFVKDMALQRTSSGTHKDDLQIEINGYSTKKFASLGQQKTMLLSLKLAQFGLISDTKGFKPLLLLDDVFDRLDRERIINLIEIIGSNEFGQIIISDTNVVRVRDVFKSLKQSLQIFMVNKGQILNGDAGK